MENLTNWCVYMHENRVNGKKYIGITSNKPTKRWANGDGYKKCPLFYKAIKKYGWDSFRHELLFTDLTEEEACNLEIELIKKYKSNTKNEGYNLAGGGKVNSGFHRTDEFKEKLSKTRKKLYSGENHNMFGTHRSEETKRKLREANIGKEKSEETKKNMSLSARKRWVPENEKEREYLRTINKGGNSAKAIPVLCIESGIIYDSISDASEQTGTELSSIVRCCKHQRKTAGGYHWEYAKKEVNGE